MSETIFYGIKNLNNEELKTLYEQICESYRRRLCAMWEINFEDSWWFADKIGEGLNIADWWMSIDMPELRYIIENNVSHESWLEYCDFVESEINSKKVLPRINFNSWFKGLRPEMLKDDE